MTIDARELGGLTKYTAYLFDSSGTFTTPAVMPSNYAYITAVAGGGSGANATGANTHTTGGDSGQYCIKFPVILAPSTTYTITIGAGGAALSASAESSGNSGGDTSFGSLLALKGGKGGRIIPAASATLTDVAAYSSQSGGVLSRRLVLSFESPPQLLGITSPAGLNGNKHGDNSADATTGELATGGAPGLFGSGTDASTTTTPTTAPAANSGAGSGAVAGAIAASGAGAAGKLILEIEEFL